MIKRSTMIWMAAANAIRDSPDDLLTLAAFADLCNTSNHEDIRYLGFLAQAFLQRRTDVPPPPTTQHQAIAHELANHLFAASAVNTVAADFTVWLYYHAIPGGFRPGRSI